MSMTVAGYEDEPTPADYWDLNGPLPILPRKENTWPVNICKVCRRDMFACPGPFNEHA